MPDQEVFVQFKNVQKSYDGETLVVKEFNLDIYRREFLTMLGPSGSGKTTCLMMLAGFEATTHGDIILEGRSINNLPPHKRDIGMVFQNYALFPHMTVFENIAYPLQMRKTSKTEIERRVSGVLDMVQLGDFGHRRPNQLSGGQQQRVAVARALVFEPKIVLMDEPLGALDRQLREQMQYEIRHIHESVGVTVVYVTHDQGEALTMSNRIAVFDDGVVQQLATPGELYQEPKNAFVAQFIGENNALRGTVTEIHGAHCTVEAEGGHIVQAMAINVGGVGSATTVSLRPERIVINPSEGSVPNLFDGRVEELIFHGDHLRTRLRVCGHDDFIVKVPNSTGHVEVRVGDQVRVGWERADARALDAPGD